MRKFALLTSLLFGFALAAGHAQTTTTCPAPTVTNGQMNVAGAYGGQPKLCWPASTCPAGASCTFNVYQAAVTANQQCSTATFNKITNVSATGWVGSGFGSGQWCFYVTTVIGSGESGPSGNYVYAAIAPPAPATLTGAVGE